MTSQLLTRVPTELKRQFKARTREQGVSMDFLMNVFIRTYVERPQIIQTYVEEEAFDEMIRRSFDTPKAKAAMESLFETIKSK